MISYNGEYVLSSPPAVRFSGSFAGKYNRATWHVQQTGKSGNCLIHSFVDSDGNWRTNIVAYISVDVGYYDLPTLYEWCRKIEYTIETCDKYNWCKHPLSLQHLDIDIVLLSETAEEDKYSFRINAIKANDSDYTIMYTGDGKLPLAIDYKIPRMDFVRPSPQICEAAVACPRHDKDKVYVVNNKYEVYKIENDDFSNCIYHFVSCDGEFSLYSDFIRLSPDKYDRNRYEYIITFGSICPTVSTIPKIDIELCEDNSVLIIKDIYLVNEKRFELYPYIYYKSSLWRVDSSHINTIKAYKESI